MAEIEKIITVEEDGEKTRALLVSLLTPEMSEREVETSLDELERLLDTAGGEAVLRVIQARPSPDNKTFIGKGKCEEIAEYIKNDGNISMVIFDNELSPSQIKNLEDALDVRVIDRTMLILDIFALHAVTGEGKLQVEIACLRYTAPRIMGKGKMLSRLGGGIGTRGPGESQLETDRRHLQRRIEALTERLTELERTSEVKRKGRDKNGMKTVAIAGYTNAGKSTLLNYLTGAGVLSEDKLFATLDPTTRKLTLPDGTDVLLTDTVGFIDRLPTHLVKAFRSTLEEIRYADVIICLIDASEADTERTRKKNVTLDLVNELTGEAKEIIWCYNKCDEAIDTEFMMKDAVCVSAKTGKGVEDLLAKIKEVIDGGRKTLCYFFPHSEAAEMNRLFRSSAVLDTEYTDEGAVVKAIVEPEAENRFARFVQNN